MRAAALSIALLTFAVGATASKPAEAVSTRLTLGANYWFVKTGVFDLGLAIDTPLGSIFSVGGRVGVMLTSSGPDVGIPLDLLLRIRITGPVSAELTGGPWIFLDGPDTIAAHFGFHIAISSGSISFGPEVSYLEPDPMIGGRLSFRF
jgi:hypothetical protein